MFSDRTDAGRRLAVELEKFRGENVIVLAIPRGGAVIGSIVAEQIGTEYSLVITRKLPFPDNPESGFGAIAEDGSSFIFPEAGEWLEKGTIERIKKEQKDEIERRKKVLRGGEPLPVLKRKTVVLVDDGIAMGSTMKASVRLCRKQGAEKIVVAVPVAGPEKERDMKKDADEVIVLETPAFFRAVAQSYANWYDVPDSEVVAIMDKWREKRRIDKGGLR